VRPCWHTPCHVIGGQARRIGDRPSICLTWAQPRRPRSLPARLNRVPPWPFLTVEQRNTRSRTTRYQPDPMAGEPPRKPARPAMYDTEIAVNLARSNSTLWFIAAHGCGCVVLNAESSFQNWTNSNLLISRKNNLTTMFVSLTFSQQTFVSADCEALNLAYWSKDDDVDLSLALAATKAVSHAHDVPSAASAPHRS
jgi:hypothetical protein